ncbi:MAG: DUF222 domain-containing protein [Gammaproteobacteria bacterium]|nr:DUF222 domain-containing protein [Gammaproteobacteria bacterium]
MSVPTEEAVHHLDFMTDQDIERLIPKVDADRVDFIPDDPAELRRAVTDMAARINLADWRFVKLIAAMERTRSWREGGYCNLGNWLDHRCGLGPCAARERIRIGRALERLPHIDAAFRDGVVSYSKVRAITRVATPHTDAMLLAIAEGSSAAQLESLVRTYERVGGSGRKRASSEQRRSLTWHYEDGMLVITAAVPAERGALVINALQQVVDGRRDEGEARDGAWLAAMGQKGTAEPAAVDGSGDAPAEWAEGVSEETPANKVVRDTGEEVTLEVEAAALTDADVSGDVSEETDGLPDWLTFALSSREQRYADALVDMAEHCLATRAGAWKRRRTGRRYEVVLTIGRNELAKQQSAGGARYHVGRDWGIDEEDARHIACDADLTEYIQDAKGDLLNYERRSRIVPARLLRALKLRDRNRCRFPGCAHQRHVEAHHVRHWIDGGETCLENLVLLCSAHHRLLHHGAYHIAMEDGDVVFVGRNGEVMPPALSPQFPGVSAELPPAPIGHDAADCPLPTRRSDVLRTHSDREVVDMLRHRQDWGRKKNARFQKELMKLAGADLRTIWEPSAPGARGCPSQEEVASPTADA